MIALKIITIRYKTDFNIQGKTELNENIKLADAIL